MWRRALPDQAQALPVRGRDLGDVGHDGASRELPAAPGPSTDLAIIAASSASTRAWTCSGSHHPTGPGHLRLRTKPAAGQALS